MKNLFAYGTLMDQEIMTTVTGGNFLHTHATLQKYIRRMVRGEVYPAIIPHTEAVVPGVVYFDLSPVAWERLDMFEGALYVRTEVELRCENGESLLAETYLLVPEYASRLADTEWSFENFLQHHKATFQSSYQGYSKLN